MSGSVSIVFMKCLEGGIWLTGGSVVERLGGVRYARADRALTPEAESECPKRPLCIEHVMNERLRQSSIDLRSISARGARFVLCFGRDISPVADPLSVIPQKRRGAALSDRTPSRHHVHGRNIIL